MTQNNKKSSNIQYTLLVTVVVLAIIVALNLLVRSFGSAYTRIDVSQSGIYNLTDITKNFVKTIDKEVYIYTIAEAGNEDAIVETVVGRYVALNDNIKHEIINPVENPQFITDYNLTLSQGSVVIVCGEKSRGIEKSDMMYEQAVQSGQDRVMIDIEGQITSALAYAVSENTPKAYLLTGGKKSIFDNEIISAIEKQNIDLEKLNLTEKKEIPQDAAFLFLYAPQADITDEEYTLLSEYMKKGGKIIFVQYFSTSGEVEYTNIGKLFEGYGVSFPAGNVIEGDASYYVDGEKPFQIYPVINAHDITNSHIANKKKVMLFISNRIQVDKDKVPSNVKVDTFLQTSHTAYLKSPTDSSMIKLPTDTTGVFNLAVAIEDSSNNGRAVVFASYAIADLKSDNTVNGANSELLVSSIRWLTGQEELISVNSKFFGLSNLVYTAKEKQNVLIIVVFVIPAGILAYGLSVWFKRRRK